MVRTQIYLTEQERVQLQALVRQTGQSQSALIRQAVDQFLTQYRQQDRNALLRQAKGLWQQRDDLPDIQVLRQEWERHIDSGA